jgi:phosphoglycolate phosphatase-like HAD superfamily hydrolase
MEMGQRAGCGARIGVLTGTSCAADLGPVATVVLDSIAALEAWLDEQAVQ